MHRIFNDELEDKIDLLLYIGRTESIKRDCALQLENELEREGRYVSYSNLLKLGLVELVNQIQICRDHKETTLYCRLTDKGRSVYLSIENAYSQVRSNISEKF